MKHHSHIVYKCVILIMRIHFIGINRNTIVPLFQAACLFDSYEEKFREENGWTP